MTGDVRPILAFLLYNVVLWLINLFDYSSKWSNFGCLGDFAMLWYEFFRRHVGLAHLSENTARLISLLDLVGQKIPLRASGFCCALHNNK